MEPMNLPDRVRGCVLGAAIGDAMGGPVEFARRRGVRRVAGKGEWIRDLLPYSGRGSVHGPWRDRAPAGCGTGDTRLRVIFLETAIRRRGLPVRAADLAREFLRRQRRPGLFYPGHAAFAKEWLDAWAIPARAVLRRARRVVPGAASSMAVASVAPWGGFPVCCGLVSAILAGLMRPGRPADAYRSAFDLAFHDTGFARDVAGIGAGLIAAACAGRWRTRGQVAGLLARSAKLDPYRSGKVTLGGRPLTISLEKSLELARHAHTPARLVRFFARWFEGCAPCDSRAILGAAFASLHVAGLDGARAVVIAANHRVLDSRGRLRRMCDADTIAGIAGAFAGALFGENAFPAEWRRNVIEANREVYGFDLGRVADRFAAVLRE